MQNFEYLEPRTLAEACGFLDTLEEAKILAGGMSLMMLLRNNLIAPSYLINLKTVPGLANVKYTSKSGAKIGALVTHHEVTQSPVIRERYPILAEAGSRIAPIGVRCHGTIGGDLCHAEPNANFPPALIVLNARLKIASSKGQRSISVEELFVDYLESSLQAGEVLTEIEIPPLPSKAVWSYLELNRASNSAGTASVAVILGLDSAGRCNDARLALGGVGFTPIKVDSVKDILVGEKITPGLIAKVALEAQKHCNPIANVYGSVEYKREMAKVLTARALEKAIAGARAV